MTQETTPKNIASTKSYILYHIQRIYQLSHVLYHIIATYNIDDTYHVP